MVRRSLRLHRSLVPVVTGLLLILAACAPSAGGRLGVPDSAVVDIGEAAVAARMRGADTVEVVALPAGAPNPQVWASSTNNTPISNTNTTQLFVLGGDVPDATKWKTIFYGSARSDVARVVVDRPEYRGGTVVNGVWVILIPEDDLKPDDIGWEFLRTDGTAVLSGRGLLAP